ncbi:MAG: DUF2905 domain-containing protein [Methylovulum sp.]|nr:DUF2905 domain-containing protein [Methylovulum sp.]
MGIGKILATLGLMLFMLGLLMQYAPWLINWFGRLPGDIRIEDESKTVFIPITSMFVISMIITVIVNLFFRMTRD